MPATIMRNRANNTQARVPQIKHRRSVFGMNKNRKQTMKAAYLVPIFYEEVIPGDTWEINMSALIRLMPQVAPPIDNLTISTFFFFDPHRLQWKNFTKQHGEKDNPDDTIDYITPKMTCPDGGFDFRSLQDYLGKPCGVDVETTSLPERMYNRIYNNYFRSEFLQDSVYINEDDADDEVENYELKKITKMHDYFTDALPTLQQGDPVQIPLGTRATVWGEDGTALNINIGNSTYGSWITHHRDEADFTATIYADSGDFSADMSKTGTTNTTGKKSYANVISKEYANENGIALSGLYADLSTAVGADISALRLMIQTQQILERDNRNGVRYTEMLEGRYGTINPDLRLTRPQYLGGTKTPFFTTPVVQTSGTGTTGQNTPQGNLSGYGVTSEKGNVIRQSFSEWGAIMGLMAITATPQYQYGVQRKFTRFERFDYMYPEFMGLSDQGIKNKELYVTGDEETDEEVWGYIGRYDEYRYFNNEICGELRSNYPESLEVWTYAENMNELQNLNSNFIEDKTDEIVKRSMAVTSDENGGIEDQFIVDLAFNGAVSRVLTSKAVPQTGGRLL